ncbi:MAG: hypothetical protein FWJ70_15370 [Micromonosporaceae bacterium]
MTGWELPRLAAFRGGFPTAPLDARRVAGLLDVPGCRRRQVIDAAGVGIEPLARLLGCPPAGQSPYAIVRARQFERLVTGDAMGSLLALARDLLGAPVTAVRQVDLSPDEVRSQYGRADPPFRATLTAHHVRMMLDGDEAAVNLLRRPVLTLTVGGSPIHVEPDVVAYTTTDPLHPVEIRSYPCVDGVADEDKVSATARETAVHVLAVRELSRRLGHDDTRVAAAGLLVMPRNFSLTPTGARLDVTPQTRRVRRALDVFPDPATLAASVPDGVSLPAPPPPGATAAERDAAAAQAAEAVGALAARFGDGCASCALFAFCRAEQQASGAVARTGDAAANLCGDVGTVAAALDLAHGRRTPVTPAERALAADLGRAAAAAAWAGLDEPS